MRLSKGKIILINNHSELVQDYVGTGVQNSNCIKFFFQNYIILNIIYIYIYLNLSYDIHVKSLSYIVFDLGVSNEIITHNIIVIGL